MVQDTTLHEESELKIMIIIELMGLMAFTAGMVWYCRSPAVPTFVCTLVFFSWYMGLCGTLLLPADIAYAQINSLTSDWILGAWQTVYWVTFVLAWIVLPVSNAAWHAGELSWGKRIRAAIRAHMVTYLVMAVIGIAVIIYLLFNGMATRDSLRGVLMAWSNTYGLLLIVLLMGHGLVEIPRQLWTNSYPERQLQKLYFRAVQIDTELYDSIYEFEEADKIFERYKKAVLNMKDPSQNRPNRDEYFMYIDAIQRTKEVVGAFYTGFEKSTLHIDKEDVLMTKVQDTVSISGLISLHSRLRKNQERVISCAQRWDDLINKVTLVESIVNYQLPKPVPITFGRGSNPINALLILINFQVSRVTWIWNLYIRHICLRALSVVCCILSSMVIWSEVVLAVPINLSALGYITKMLESGNPFIIQAATLIPFLYMSICCYRSLFKLKLFGSFALNGPHQSSPGQLMFNAQYLVRLQFTLGYNFLKLLKFSGKTYQNIAFNKLMSDMAVVPILGTNFNVYAPLIMVLLCIFTFCHGYVRLLRIFGVEHEDIYCITDKDGQERSVEGKNLIERCKRKKALKELRQYSGPNSSYSGPNNIYRPYERVIPEGV